MAATDLLTLADARKALNIDDADTSEDAELAIYISAVSGRIDDLCGPVVERTVTELHNGDMATLRPRKTPVRSITTVTEYLSGTGTLLTAETNTVTTANNYLLVADRHDVSIRRRSTGADRSFTFGRNNIEVVYKAGRVADTAAVPEKFRLAAAIFLSHLWRREQGAGTVSFPEDSLTPGIPTFGVPYVVKDLLEDELLPLSIG